MVSAPGNHSIRLKREIFFLRATTQTSDTPRALTNGFPSPKKPDTMHDYDGLCLLVGLYDIRQLRTSDFVIDKGNICIYRYIYIIFFQRKSPFVKTLSLFLLRFNGKKKLSQTS